MKKKLLSTLLTCALFTLALTGCSGKTTDTPENSSEPSKASTETVSEDPFKVAWISSVPDSWHHQNCTITENYLKENLDTDVEVKVMDCKNWDEAEISALLEQISLAVDYDLLILGTQSDRTEELNALQENGTNVILAVGSYPWAEGKISIFNSSEYQLGYLVAEAAAKELPEGANVVLLRGLQGYWGSEERGKGFHDALAARKDITILDEQYATYDKAKAMAVMDDWITAYGDEINCVISENDVMALGAVESMNAAGMSADDVYVYGIDGLYEGCEAVKEGIIRTTSYNDCQKFAEAYLDRAKKLLSGEMTSTDVEDAIIEPAKIDSTNVQSYLDYYVKNGFNK